MSKLPQVPPSVPIIPTSNRRRVDIPTYSGGQLTPKENLTMPTFGQGAVNIVKKITDQTAKIDTNIASDVAFKKGKNQQATNQEYVGNDFAFTLTGQAYKKGVDATFVSMKETELENGLKLMREKYLETNDVDGYVKASENYKNKFMENIPEQFFGDFNTYYDKFDQRNATALTVSKRSQELTDGSFKISEQSKTLAERISENIAFQGITESLIDDLSILNRNNLSQKDIFGRSLEARTKERANQKEIITKGAARNVYDAIKNDPTAYKEWLNQIADGNWNLGDLGDEEVFSKAFPGGVNLDMAERQTVISYVESLRKQDKTSLAIASAQLKNTATSNNTNLTTTGWDTFRDPEGNIDKSRAVFDLDAWLANDGDAAVGIELSKKNAVGIFVADQLEFVKTDTTTAIPSRIAILRAEIQNINDLKLSDGEKAFYIDSRTAAIKAMENEMEQRTTTLKNGNEVDSFITQNRVTATDLRMYEGNVDVMTQTAHLNNTSFYMVKPSKTQSKLEYGAVQVHFDNKDINSYIIANNDGISRQRSLYYTMFRTGIAENKGATDADWAKASLSERARRDSTSGDTKLLFNIIANYDDIGEANGQKDKEEKNKFFVEISEGLYEFDNDFGRAKKGEFNVVYDYYRNRKNKSESEAAKLAKDYVLGGMIRLDTNYGVTYVSPNHLMGEFEASGDTAMNTSQMEKAKKDLIEQINNTYNRPERSSLTVIGKSIDDWVAGDRDNYKVVLMGNSLRLVTKDVGSGSLTKFTVLTKRPSAGNTLFYTDLSIPVKISKEEITAYEDESPTWEYDDTINGMGSFKEPKTATRLKVITEVGLDETDVTPVEKKITETATLDDKAIALFKHYEKKGYIVQDEVEGFDEVAELPQVRMLYEDPFSQSMFPTNPPDQGIANAISLAFAKNKGQAWMIEWLMSKSEYTGGSSTDHRETAKLTLNYWKDNFDTIKNLQTDTDTPTRMDVLQALITTIKDQPTIRFANDGFDFGYTGE